MKLEIALPGVTQHSLIKPYAHMLSDRRVREAEAHYRVEEEDGKLALVSPGEKGHRFEISQQHVTFHISGRPAAVSRSLEDGKRWIAIGISELEIGTAADMGYSSLLGSNSSWVIHEGRLKYVPLKAVRLEPLSEHLKSLDRIKSNRQLAAGLGDNDDATVAETAYAEDAAGETEPLALVQLGHYRGQRLSDGSEEEIYLEMGLRDDAFGELYEACVRGQVHELYLHVEVFALSTGSRFEIARDLLMRPNSSIPGDADSLVARFIPEVRTPPAGELDSVGEEAADWNDPNAAEQSRAEQLTEGVCSALLENTRQLSRAHVVYLGGSVVLGMLTLLLGGGLAEAALLALLGGVFLLVEMVRRLVVALSVEALANRTRESTR